MKKRYINAIFFILIILATAFGGLYIGQSFLHKNHAYQNAESAGWHVLLHQKLHITAEQDAKLSEIEKHYREKKLSLEKQMRLANIELAEAIKADKTFSPKVRAATDKIHHVMGELQKTTLEHLFEMRPILTDKQNQLLEQMITDALYEKK